LDNDPLRSFVEYLDGLLHVMACTSDLDAGGTWWKIQRELEVRVRADAARPGARWKVNVKGNEPIDRNDNPFCPI
jgi:hypothetical protein